VRKFQYTAVGLPVLFSNYVRLKSLVKSSISRQWPIRDDIQRYLALAISPVALIYGLLAGLRTVGDPDLGWQLATGRWIVQHHRIPHTDVLSYTARGQEWIYPALSQIIQYGCYALGGYSLLSWLGAVASVGTIAILLRRGNTITRVLAIAAVPLIALRTAPRAEMFTEILFATVLSVLWFYHRSGSGPVWALPVLMCLWANLHLGFISGLALCVAYVFLELGEAVFDDQRAAALSRLHRAWVWLLAAVMATLLNPWGARIYVAVARQAEILRFHSRWIVEWLPVPFTPIRLTQALAWRDGRSAVWWLIAAVFLAIFVAVYRRRVAPVVLLGASVYLVLHAMRFQGPFASLAVIVGGSILADAPQIEWVRRAWQRLSPTDLSFRRTAAVMGFLVLLAFLTVRGWDLVSNRFYMRTIDQYSAFGPGLSWWYPDQAAAFVMRERPPANIFNEYDLGGFVSWMLSPAYADYIDGRAVPFGGALFFHSAELLQSMLDGAKWRQEADTRNINTLIVSVDREYGEGLSKLYESCRSRSWRPIYLDPHAAVFVRVRPENASVLDRWQLDCDQVHFDSAPQATGFRGRSERFNYYLNSAAILVVLERYMEALGQLKQAERVFDDNAFLHYEKGVALQSTGDEAGAERELRESVALDHLDGAARALASLYLGQGRPADAAAILSREAEWSPRPHQLYLELGAAQLAMGAPDQALLSFDHAEKESPFLGEAAPLGASFNTMLAEGRTRAWRSLADIYEARGLHREALQALQRAASIAATQEETSSPR